jgi:hypothetical protein
VLDSMVADTVGRTSSELGHSGSSRVPLPTRPPSTAGALFNFGSTGDEVAVQMSAAAFDISGSRRDTGDFAGGVAGDDSSPKVVYNIRQVGLAPITTSEKCIPSVWVNLARRRQRDNRSTPMQVTVAGSKFSSPARAGMTAALCCVVLMIVVFVVHLLPPRPPPLKCMGQSELGWSLLGRWPSPSTFLALTSTTRCGAWQYTEISIIGPSTWLPPSLPFGSTRRRQELACGQAPRRLRERQQSLPEWRRLLRFVLRPGSAGRTVCLHVPQRMAGGAVHSGRRRVCGAWDQDRHCDFFRLASYDTDVWLKKCTIRLTSHGCGIIRWATAGATSTLLA